LNDKYDTLQKEYKHLEKCAIDAQTKLEKASKFSLSSFIIHFMFYLLIIDLLYFFIEISK
jgi:hypothetical protein